MFFGDAYYGKVDAVPGLFHVQTRFVHFWWIPFVPRESSLFLDDNTPRGVRIPLRWKSVLLAWVRAFLLLQIVALLIGAVESLGPNVHRGNVHPAVMIACAGIISLFCGALYWMTYWLAPAKLSRAIELGQRLGMPRDEIERWFEPVKPSQPLRPAVVCRELSITGGLSSTAIQDLSVPFRRKVVRCVVLAISLTLGMCLGLVNMLVNLPQRPVNQPPAPGPQSADEFLLMLEFGMISYGVGYPVGRLLLSCLGAKEDAELLRTWSRGHMALVHLFSGIGLTAVGLHALVVDRALQLTLLVGLLLLAIGIVDAVRALKHDSDAVNR
ncbi:MAG: hypothetical protein SH850_20870 [Planctomycetaceae bacterium]|nr:hypothetical protein [Planctomycetaceae bacterium]